MTNISGMSGFFDWLEGLGWKSGEKKYLFRGVSSKKYDPVEASSYRRLLQDEFGLPHRNNRKTLSNLLKINRDLIDEARFRGFDRKYDRVLSDLEILGELQHFRAATCLIDFTFYPGIALWFACQPSSEEGEDGEYGKVVAVRNDEKIKEVRCEWLSKEKRIEDFFKADESGKYPIYRWEPENITNRVERQEGVFLFGGGKIEIEDECYIHSAYHWTSLIVLRNLYNTHEEILFPDFDGFVRRHAHDIPYNLDDKEIGYKAYNREHYEKAINSFTQALCHKPDDIASYYMRGRARFEMKFYAEALKDFEKVLNLNERFPYFHSLTYWQRGCLKAEVGQHNEAREDYRIGLQLARKINRTSIIAWIEEDLAKLES